MAYNDDSVLAKLSAVNESHDSIATSAQWILFHRRHADRTVQLWMQRLKGSSSTKRLSLVYLANEVTQQSKARNKMDFVEAYTPVIAEAIAAAYKGAPIEIQGKLKRVVDVWRDRRVFEDRVQEDIDSRIADLDKVKGQSGHAFGVSPFASGSPPAVLAPLITGYQHAIRQEVVATDAVSSANQEHRKIIDPSAAVPSPPVYAARLNGLLKVLATAEGVVAESVKARKGVIAELEKLLDSNRRDLASDEAQLQDMVDQKADVENRKQEVELAIMRGLNVSDNRGSPADGPSASPPPEPDRPEVEALTPPHINEDTPMSDRPYLADAVQTQDATVIPYSANSTSQPGPETLSPVYQHPPAPGIEMLSNLASQYQSLPVATNGSNKRRRLDAADEFPDLGADDGIDADVAEMLRNDRS